MADKTGREGSTNNSARRSSFRKTLADHAESGLPSEYLDQLEQKRKQLDESIHKYIAVKEREYKTFERDLRQQHKLAREKEGTNARRLSSEAASQSSSSKEKEKESPRLAGKQQAVVDTLLAAGLRRDQIGQSVAVAVVDDDNTSPTLETKAAAAGLTDRRASAEREKEFVGVFTPAFLPALENKAQSHSHGHSPRNATLERASSDPPVCTPDRKPAEADLPRAESEPMVGAKPRRPAELQFVHRNSSSGSSVEGRLASALKSPTHPSSRTKRKRVSLAVGDVIVAPSDNVPITMNSNNSTPSHSRSRSPAPGREQSPMASLNGQMQTDESALPPPMMEVSEAKKPITNGKAHEQVQEPSITEAPPPAVPSIPPPTTSPPKIDPDGDLFDLHEDDDDHTVPISGDESGDEIAGRVDLNPESADGEIYDPNAGLIEESSHSSDHAEHVEFIPGSAVASQQPTNPGFRRPSATFDPIYRGANYESAEHSAVVNDVYGSSYNRPNKGSFTAGSMGESFMAQNAERMMRDRVAREQPQVPS